MSGITLSASVRQNLLSLQSTADLLSTTQNRLATGNKVNSALDNPTNFFTAQGLNNRAGDINNLLDGIGNGVQILQAANTGITSLQKLVDSAKSIANQALQATSGYSTKSTATTAAVTGATADNLLGPASGATAGAVTAGAFTTLDLSTGGDSQAFTVTVDGAAHNITINSAAVTAYNTAKGTTLSDAALTAQNVADLTNYQIDNTGATTIATVAAGVLKFTSPTTGSTSSIATTAVTGTATSGSTGIVVGTNTGVAGTTALDGKTLSIAATDGGTATNITFGATGVHTLDQLNSALSANNLQASISNDGKLSFTTTNDHASATIGAFTGSAIGAGAGLFGASLSAAAPVADANAQNTRASLVAQYNTVIDQIKTTAADSSFNGVNLLNGDTLALTFNETGKSKLSISGVTFDPAGLGLASLAKGTDFLDNAGTNKLLTTLNTASSTLRSQASAFGSNLSVVQLRQDFSKSLINVLQTGASSLTLADTNEEAANSQALSTRQSIAVSALSLANQSQQGVLQLLR
jgi:flagellin-like hook-associated protein FlgL